MIEARDLLNWIGTSALQKFGTLTRKTMPINKSGEDAIEVFTRAAPDANAATRSGVLIAYGTDRPRIRWMDLNSDGVRETPTVSLEGSRANICLQSQALNITHQLTVTGGSGTFTDGETVNASGGGSGVYRASYSTSTVFALSGGSGTMTGTLTGASSTATRTISSSALVWAVTRSSVSADADAAPDGTTTADRLIEDGTATNSHFIQQTGLTITANANVVYTVYAKAGGRSWIRVRLVDGTSTDGFSAFFNISTGAIGSTALSGTGTLVSKVITPMANSWYRCELVGNIGNSRTSATAQVLLANADNSTNYSGDGVSYVSLWGADVKNNGSFSDSYIGTTTASVTRAADQFKVVYPYQPMAACFYVKFVEGGSVATANTRVFNLGNDGGTGALLKVQSSGTFYQAIYTDGTTTKTATLAAAPTYGQTVELLVTLTGAGVLSIEQSINAAASTTASATALTLPSAWGGSSLWINSLSTSNVGFMALHSFVPTRGTGFTLSDFRTLVA